MGHWFRSEGLFAASRQSPGQKSKVHTNTLEMELDHDSGQMEGRCLKGQFAGRALSSLSNEELLQLLEELRTTDPQGAFLIEVRLSSPSQDWRGRTNRTTQPTVVTMALLAVAAFLLFIFRQRISLNMGPLFGSNGPFRTSRKSPGQKSEVYTEALKMELDHDSGHMEGRCLKGQFAGKALSSLSQEELLQLLIELRDSDPQGALLVEAYLDRRSQHWRSRRSEGDARERRHPRGPRGRMTSKEAYDVLGLEEGAREEDIRAAHRRLMMKLHPDQGGSTYLASRINEAKEVLVRHN